MRTIRGLGSVLGLILGVFALCEGCHSPNRRSNSGPPAPSQAAAACAAKPAIASEWGRLSLRFEENRGQFDERVRYVARQGGMTLFLTDAGAVMSLSQGAARDARRDPKAMRDPRTLAERAKAGPAPKVLTMKVHHAQPAAKLEARQALVTRSNYFIGNDSKKWRTDVPNFGEVVYRNVRRGVDLVYHGSGRGRLEYDFVVAPGASPEVSLDVDGADDLRVAKDGALEIDLGGSVLRQPPPTVYQMIDGVRRELAGRYRIIGHARVGFTVAAYDRARPLVVDPVLLYSTYLGGSGDDYPSLSVAVDASGAAYLSGFTTSTNFPVAGVPSSFGGGIYDAFVTKLVPAGNALAYSTYLGGSGYDFGAGVEVDASGAAYVVGATYSANFPVVHAFQSTYGGGGSADAFVTKLAPAGNALSIRPISEEAATTSAKAWRWTRAARPT